jgi:hypothetical protein
MRITTKLIATSALLAWTLGVFAAENACSVRSGASLTPVIELYTSEGCSSCPPADKWASTLKGANTQGRAVVQAFHVGYWDYIGWVDRFAAPAYTTRQRQIASANGLGSIYTPQVVRNGRDWRDFSRALTGNEPAQAQISLARLTSTPQGDQFEATVAPTADASWSAYWTVTEHGHSSKVKSGENAGEFLQHDFVVRQYTPAGDYKGPARLTLRSLAADPQHPRQVNLVVFEPKTGKTLQAVSLSCTG